MGAPEGATCAVAVPRHLFTCLTYRVPEALRDRVAPGVRVRVPLGRSTAVAYVTELDPADPGPAALKAVREVLDDRPLFDAELLGLLRWAAEYYRHPLGEVFASAHPGESGRGRGGPRYRLTPAGRTRLEGLGAQTSLFGPTEVRPLARLLAPLLRQPRTIAQLRRAAGAAYSPARLARCLAEGLIMELVPGRPAARARQGRVRALETEAPPGRLGTRQRALLDELTAAGGLDLAELRRRLGPTATATVRSLERRELVVVEALVEEADPADRPADLETPTPLRLTPDQAAALAALDRAAAAQAYAPFLLWGVTGSGKTEVYLRLAEHILNQGRTVLVLVPEIALTPQLAARFHARFGNTVAVLHSSLPPAVRREEWRRCREGRARIALGPRSAVFAPLPRPGLIVVDEEHDGSLKAEEGFRYSARDLAVVRARHAGAVLLLGSATPSLESLHNARRGRYRLLELPTRVAARSMPTVEVVPARALSGDQALGPELHQALGEALARGEQVMLFLNRRGYAPLLLCRACGAGAQCPNCSVGLTAHRREGRLLCHYCGFAQRPPETCPQCGSPRIGLVGVGTERLEAQVRQAFPAARTARLDRDVAARRGALAEVLAAFRRGERDVLLGTQMVAKGHHFPGVTLVGIVLADLGLNLPDFRAAERTYQLLTQVAGRAGRGERPGRVIVQALDPSAPAIRAARDGDPRPFLDSELQARAELGYPPFARLALIRLSGTEEARVVAAARDLAARARTVRVRGVQVLGPAPAPLVRLRRRVRWQLLVKAPDDRARRAALDRLLDGTQLLSRPPTGVRVAVDMDPNSML